MVIFQIYTNTNTILINYRIGNLKNTSHNASSTLEGIMTTKMHGTKPTCMTQRLYQSIYIQSM